VLLIGQFRLFEHNVDFLHIRTGQSIKVDHGNILELLFPRFAKAANLAASLWADKVAFAKYEDRGHHLCEIAEYGG
jgi:hypothetical protein